MSEVFENPQFPDLVTAHERTIQAAHDNPQQPESYRVAQSPRPESRSGEVVSRTYDPAMLKYIAQLTGGDTRRLVYREDGSITIANNPQR